MPIRSILPVVDPQRRIGGPALAAVDAPIELAPGDQALTRQDVERFPWPPFPAFVPGERDDNPLVQPRPVITGPAPEDIPVFVPRTPRFAPVFPARPPPSDVLGQAIHTRVFGPEPSAGEILERFWGARPSQMRRFAVPRGLGSRNARPGQSADKLPCCKLCEHTIYDPPRRSHYAFGWGECEAWIEPCKCATYHLRCLDKRIPVPGGIEDPLRIAEYMRCPEKGCLNKATRIMYKCRLPCGTIHDSAKWTTPVDSGTPASESDDGQGWVPSEAFPFEPYPPGGGLR
ncbi:hypothetical protein FN846DRAFT_1024972 [Sphaerosporella brunnea]|uniref:Uncharacterized protein n=1 Tax=Sphaerosporella brunnea TaxID=1250544 RepID=A0A5J5EHZ3_9PEZI|nr:hypothetical protein FN846DRAFT_1024972 [Sphaerosporella brunnea]